MNVNLMYHNIKLTKELLLSDYDVSLEQLAHDIKCVQASDIKEVNFTFDDGQDGSLLAAKLLSQHQIRGIFFIISNKIGSNGYLSEDDIKNIHQMGHVIGSHSHTHPMFNKLSDDEVIFQLKKSKDILENITLHKVTNFAFPSGRRKKHHIIIAKELGYQKVFNSFERFATEGLAEVPRFHVRQSNRGCVEKITNRKMFYTSLRYIRSILVEIKSIIL